MSTQKVVKLSLCGASAVGKSSIGFRLANKEPNMYYVSTIGLDYFSSRLHAYNTRIGIWDLAGDKRFETITTQYIKDSDIILYVYDLTRPSTVLELRKLHQIYEKMDNRDQIKIIVVGNKKDKENTCDHSNSLGEIFANELEVPHLIISAKKNSGIYELLSTIVTEMKLKKFEVRARSVNKDTVRWWDRCILC